MSEKLEENKAFEEVSAKQDLADAPKGKDWKKIAFVVLITVVLYLEVIYLVPLLVLTSAAFYLIKGQVDERVANFSGALVEAIAGSLSYALFHSDNKPWPLGPWPSMNSVVEEVVDDKKSSSSD
jgi:hypothetical protein